MLFYKMSREEVYEACSKYILEKGYKAFEIKDLKVELTDFLYLIDMPIKDKEKK